MLVYSAGNLAFIDVHFYCGINFLCIRLSNIPDTMAPPRRP